MSAFGGKADMASALQMSAYDPKRTFNRGPNDDAAMGIGFRHFNYLTAFEVARRNASPRLSTIFLRLERTAFGFGAEALIEVDGAAAHRNARRR